jgi:hypothetical protein
MKIHFETSFEVDVPEETGDKVVIVLENYINTITKLLPKASSINVGVAESDPERRTA